jgi:hypothetical protein
MPLTRRCEMQECNRGQIGHERSISQSSYGKEGIPSNSIFFVISNTSKLPTAERALKNLFLWKMKSASIWYIIR